MPQCAYPFTYVPGSLALLHMLQSKSESHQPIRSSRGLWELRRLNCKRWPSSSQPLPTPYHPAAAALLTQTNRRANATQILWWNHFWDAPIVQTILVPLCVCGSSNQCDVWPWLHNMYTWCTQCTMFRKYIICRPFICNIFHYWCLCLLLWSCVKVRKRERRGVE